ncbi:hypothetical protein TTHT_1128 [Thermotomaculum hydrothermale]|uniref:ParB domain protein nuclease n=1 Tax=Thermotomaculum hydrothermale TaxID=981385 RepID=A0A7R6PM65_9BACT|nr:ParB/RepB/Spo0J family partition protein [Thermotomaculum hydrothermale]BBB32662.1 hypothetical protein TTHT_1128 [Thermotomaculum hydrothermale]
MIQYIEKDRIVINEKFRIRSELNNSIAKSVREFGIVSPVILLNDFTLIDGFSRLNFSKEDKIPAIIEEDSKKAFLKSVELNMLVNPYSEFEKARVIKFAVEYFNFSEEFIVKKLNPVLKFAKKVSVVYDCFKIFDLDKELFSLLESKKSPISFALSLSREDKENQVFLAKVFKEKRLSFSRMQIAYDLMFYIRKRDSIDFKEIAKKCKEEDFVLCLERIRSPKYSEFKDELNEILSKYKGYLNFPKDMEAGFFSFS